MGTQPLTPKGVEPPIFGPRILWPNACACIKMPLVTEVGLGLFIYATLCLMWTQLPAEKRHTHPHPIFGPCQTAGWMKTPLGTEVDLGPGHIVLDGVPAPANGAQQRLMCIVATVAHLRYCPPGSKRHRFGGSKRHCYNSGKRDNAVYLCLAAAGLAGLWWRIGIESIQLRHIRPRPFDKSTLTNDDGIITAVEARHRLPSAPRVLNFAVRLEPLSRQERRRGGVAT